jgi:uncharacterized protein
MRRGTLLVILCGRAQLYAGIYLQAERSSMPGAALGGARTADRLAYGPTFKSAMKALFDGEAASLSAAATPVERDEAHPLPPNLRRI